MVRIILPLIAAATLTVLPATAHAAGDAKAGRQKARPCQTCHGLDGLSKIPEAPNIAGQVETYLVKTLTEFRDGTRKNEMMTVVVQELSPQDIADLAAYYASIEIVVNRP